MDFGAFGDFDDDLFDCKKKKGSNDVNEAILNYRPKEVNLDV